MDGLDLHPGDYVPVIKDPEERRIMQWDIDDELEDEINETMFESIRYYFLVRLNIKQIRNYVCKEYNLLCKDTCTVDMNLLFI